jgi:hypothetical protein
MPFYIESDSPTTVRSHGRGELFLLGIIPALLLMLAAFIAYADGPHYWGMAYDPNYAYLFNSLNLLQGTAPRHNDHPGVTIQMFGALIIFIVHLFRSGTPLVEDVINQSELYLSAIIVGLAICYAISVYYLGWLVWRIYRSLLWAITVEGLALMFPFTLLFLTRDNPEIAILTLGNLLAAEILRIGLGKASASTPSRLGILTGACLMTKFTFLPALLLGYLVLPRFPRRYLKYSLALGGTVAFFLLPIITRVRAMFRWLAALALHSGGYGSGKRNVVDPHKAFQWLCDYLTNNALYSIILIFCFVILALVWRSSPRFPRRVLAALGLYHIAILILVSKHPSSFGEADDRYMIASLVLVLPTLLLAIDLLSKVRPETEARWWHRSAQALALALMIWAGAIRVPAMYLALSRAKLERYEAQGFAKSLPIDAAVVICSWSSSRPFALFCANEWAGRRYDQPLIALFPEFLMYECFGGFYTYRAERYLPDDPPIRAWFDLHSKIFFYCGLPRTHWPIEQQLPKGYALKLIQSFGEERFFVVERTSKIE